MSCVRTLFSRNQNQCGRGCLIESFHIRTCLQFFASAGGQLRLAIDNSINVQSTTQARQASATIVAILIVKTVHTSLHYVVASNDSLTRIYCILSYVA